jgi:serine phosphatase RsbU (regulator of sigma subunit)
MKNMAQRASSSIPQAMRCMEIRGGSRAVAEAIETPGLDAWIYSRPFEDAETGGDLYYVSLCGGGQITRLIVADVSGHGAHVAAFSSALRELMRKNINTKSQTRLVRALNRQFGEAARLQQFATAVVATYLAVPQTLTICNAGHPRPLWYRASTRQWGLLDASAVASGNLPLGLDDESHYHQFSVPLGRGDVVLFYSDALMEAQDSTGQMLGEEGLLALARRLEPGAPEDMGRSLLAAIEDYRGGQPAADDATLLAFAHTATGPRSRSVGERLDVYAKVFGIKSY